LLSDLDHTHTSDLLSQDIGFGTRQLQMQARALPLSNVVPSHESSRGKLLQCHMAVLRSLRQQISLTTSHQLESIIDNWKTATAYASSRYQASQMLQVS